MTTVGHINVVNYGVGVNSCSVNKTNKQHATRTMLTGSIIYLQGCVVAHFILTVWANQCPWLPGSYQLCNFIVVAVGFAAIISSSNCQIAELFFIFMALALVHDIIVMEKFYRMEKDRRELGYGLLEGLCGKKYFQLSFIYSTAILNAALKPITCVFIFLNYRGREPGGLRDMLYSRPGVNLSPPMYQQEPLLLQA